MIVPILDYTPTNSSESVAFDENDVNSIIQPRDIDQEIEFGEGIKLRPIYKYPSIKSKKQSAIDEYFKNYFNEREEKKKSIYKKVIGFGIVIFIGSLFFFYSMYWLTSSGIFWAIGMILPTLTRVIGLCMMSTVPSDRYDFFEGCIQNRKYMLILTFICGICLVALFGSLLVVLYPNPPLVYNNFSVTLPFFFFVIWHMGTFIARYSSDEIAYFWLFIKVKYNFLLIIYSNIALCFTFNIETYPKEIRARNIVVLICFIPVMLYYMGQFFNGEWKNVAVRMKGNKDFFKLLYLYCFALGVCYIGYSIVYFIYGYIIQAVVWFLTGTADLLPILFVYITGNEKCFSLTSRYFETNIEILQEDGAAMAALVASAQVFAKDEKDREVVWIKREKECTQRSAAEHCIKSGFWMKGTVIERNESSQTIRVRVVYNEDIDSRVNYYYSSTTLKSEVNEGVPVSIPFDVWISENFNKEKLIDFKSFTENNELKVVEFSETMVSSEQRSSKSLKPSTTRTKNKSVSPQSEDSVRLTLKAVSLLDTARYNLKKFDSEKFEDDLFNISPRDLINQTYKQLKGLYDRSENLVLKTKRDKIDYFISHSWYTSLVSLTVTIMIIIIMITTTTTRLDNAKVKCDNFKEFLKKEKTKKSRSPTLWLDKVCIDQVNPMDGVSVLPININACNKMLILLGSTYLNRLWCIWEVFTLCTFCNDELALERIEVILLDDYDEIIKRLENFNIDEAHCFDPKEEYKLRYIFNMIGHDNIDKIIKLMSQKVKSLKLESSRL